MIIHIEATNPWHTQQIATQLAEKWNPTAGVSIHSILGPWPSVVHKHAKARELSLAADVIDEVQNLLPLARSQNLFIVHGLPHLFARITQPIPTERISYAPYLGIAPTLQLFFDVSLNNSLESFVQASLSADECRAYRHSLLLNAQITKQTPFPGAKLSGSLEQQLETALSLLKLN